MFIISLSFTIYLKHTKEKQVKTLSRYSIRFPRVNVSQSLYKVCAGLSEFPCNQSLSVSVYRVMEDSVLLDWYIRNAA